MKSFHVTFSQTWLIETDDDVTAREVRENWCDYSVNLPQVIADDLEVLEAPPRNADDAL